MTFDQLETLLDTFDKLSFGELVNAADSDERHRELIIKYYMIPKFQLHERTINFRHNALIHYEKISRARSMIEISSIQIFLKTLRLFGHLITKLEYSQMNLDESTKQLIGESMNEYCRRSLIEISCLSSDANMTNEWKKPFENVIKVSLGSGGMSVNISNHLNVLFPNMHFLTLLPGFNSTIFQSVNGTFPNLDGVEFNPSRTNQFEDYAMNHFSNVTILSINMLLRSCPAPQHFPFNLQRLVELEIVAFDVTDQWMDIIRQMRSLRKIEIYLNELNIQQWIRIVTELPNLSEIAVELDVESNDTLDSVVESILKHRNLQKVEFLGMDEVNRGYLSDKLNANWKLIGNQTLDTNSPDAVFVRIQNSEIV